MVTIEQKVLLFSKLIDQLMNAQFKEGLKNLDEEYKNKLEINKKETDSEVKKIIGDAHKKEALENSKAYSSLKISEKKEHMLAKQKCFDRLMNSLLLMVDEFIKSDRYKSYLLGLVNELCSGIKHINNMTIYITADDYSRHSDLLSKELKKSGCGDEEYKIAITKHNIIGGFIAEDNINKLRLDLSIKALLDDNSSYIMQMLFEALEAGGSNEQ